MRFKKWAEKIRYNQRKAKQTEAQIIMQRLRAKQPPEVMPEPLKTDPFAPEPLMIIKRGTV